MKCPRCGLINPNTAQRCDCGYDFESKTVEKPYYKQEFPPVVKSYLTFVVALNVIQAIGYLVAAGRSGMLAALSVVFWIALVIYLYRQMLRRDNRARIALALLTLPVGLFLLLSREINLYFLQSKE